MSRQVILAISLLVVAWAPNAAAEEARTAQKDYLLTQTSSDCPLGIAGGAAVVCFPVLPSEIRIALTLTEDSPLNDLGGNLTARLEFVGSGGLPRDFCDGYASLIPPGTQLVRLTIRHGPASPDCLGVPEGAQSWALEGHVDATFFR